MVIPVESKGHEILEKAIFQLKLAMAMIMSSSH
jgi:hypothetical protein